MKLSVITLTHNREAMLSACLASLSACQEKDAEFLVCDDASTDGTEAFVNAVQQVDTRIRSIRNTVNLGFAGNAAMAFGRATGEYIATVPDDDMVCEGNFERKMHILDENPSVGMVWSLATKIDEAGNDHGPMWRPEYCPYSYVGREEFTELITGNYIPGPSVVFRRSLLEQYGGMDMTMGDGLSDWDLWLRFAYYAKTAFIAEPLVKVRYHSKGMISADQGKLAMAMLPVWRKWLVREDAPIIGERTWQMMFAVFNSEVQGGFGHDVSRVHQALREFQVLRQDYLAQQTGVVRFG